MIKFKKNSRIFERSDNTLLKKCKQNKNGKLIKNNRNISKSLQKIYKTQVFVRV